MNFFIVQMRKLRFIDDKSLDESQSLGAGTKPKRQLGSSHSSLPHPTSLSLLPPSAVPGAKPPSHPPSTPMFGSCIPTTGGTLPLGSSSARILRSSPGSALPAAPARKEGVGKS